VVGDWLLPLPLLPLPELPEPLLPLSLGAFFGFLITLPVFLPSLSIT
jgi:hypothetical protein